MPRYKETVCKYNEKEANEKPPSDDVEQSRKQLTEAHIETEKTRKGTKQILDICQLLESYVKDRKKIKDQMNCVKSD